jgi:hypothetical protein
MASSSKAAASINTTIALLVVIGLCSGMWLQGAQSNVMIVREGHNVRA